MIGKFGGVLVVLSVLGLVGFGVEARRAGSRPNRRAEEGVARRHSVSRPKPVAGGPAPPYWPEHSVDWWYQDENNITISGERFWWYKSLNFRVNWGHYNEGPNSDWAPMTDYANFTSQCTTRYLPAYGFFGSNIGCQALTWQRTFDYDQTFNDCQIPGDNYTYVGQQTINGVTCDGYNFIAINYPFPAGNTFWTATSDVDPLRRPIRLDILHNGRSILYTNFQVPADPAVISMREQFCGSVDHSQC